MRLFVETAVPAEARICFERKLAEGVVTSLTAADRGLVDLCAWSPGPVSAAVTSTDHEAMLVEARLLARVGARVVVRLPLNVEGLKAARACGQEGLATHLMSCDSPVQAVLAAKAGARYVSPVVGPTDQDRNDLVRAMVGVLKTYGLPTEVLATPVRTNGQAVDIALAGAAISAMPLAVLEQVMKAPAGAGGGSAPK